MTHASVQTMLDTYPKDLGNIDQHKLAECIDTCFECAQTCTACADACLTEDMVAELAKCIRTNLDCADICITTGNILSRHTGYDTNITRAVLEACQTVCRACADECERHAGMHENAASAPKRAAAVSRRARSCWPRSDKARGRPGAGAAALDGLTRQRREVSNLPWIPLPRCR